MSNDDDEWASGIFELPISGLDERAADALAMGCAGSPNGTAALADKAGALSRTGRNSLRCALIQPIAALAPGAASNPHAWRSMPVASAGSMARNRSSMDQAGASLMLR